MESVPLPAHRPDGDNQSLKLLTTASLSRCQDRRLWLKVHSLEQLAHSCSEEELVYTKSSQV